MSGAKVKLRRRRFDLTSLSSHKIILLYCHKTCKILKPNKNGPILFGSCCLRHPHFESLSLPLVLDSLHSTPPQISNNFNSL